jgi:hypothetical protein
MLALNEVLVISIYSVPRVILFKTISSDDI